MTVVDLIDHFNQEVNCTYREERYSVRDNGAVFRHPPAKKRPRLNDNRWTFGKPNDHTGIMEIASVPVHRIVATAFHDDSPGPGYVVDHIDTNKRNNRPENLRWITRLENILLNPITARRIALVCGSVDAFLANPSLFRDKFKDQNFDWMRAVTIQEAQTSYERLLAWAKKDSYPNSGTLDQWIFNRAIFRKQPKETETSNFIMSKTPNAAQRDWRIPSEFPCCPSTNSDTPLQTYAGKLLAGEVFCRNELYTSQVYKSMLSDDYQEILILSESMSGAKPWALAKITFENDLFVHSSLGNYFKQDGAEKYYCIAQGHEWTGGETFDDMVG